MKLSFRIRCFLSHLLISMFIAGSAWYIIFYVWYAAPLNLALGTDKIVLILIGIDMVLGPLLTLILAKKGKKGLKLDLVVIAVVQSLALLYGVYNIAQGRPVWLAFDHNRFDLVQAHMVSRKENEIIEPKYAQDSWFSPQWVSARPAKDKQEEGDWLFYELETGISPAMRPMLYQSIEQNIDRIIKAKEPLNKLNEYNSSIEVEKVLQQYPQADGFLPMRASQLDMTVLVDSKDKKIVGLVNLRPW